MGRRPDVLSYTTQPADAGVLPPEPATL